MKCYLILDLKIVDLKEFMNYVKSIPEFLRKHEGRYLVEGVEPKRLEGDWLPERLVILEFPSRQAAERFNTDPEIQSLFDIRRNSTVSNLILAEGSSWKEQNGIDD